MKNYKGPKAPQATGVLDDDNLVASNAAANSYAMDPIDITGGATTYQPSSFIDGADMNVVDTSGYGGVMNSATAQPTGSAMLDNSDFTGSGEVAYQQQMLDNNSSLINSMDTRNIIGGVGVGIQGLSSLLNYNLSKDALGAQMDYMDDSMAIAQREDSNRAKQQTNLGSTFSRNS